MNSADDEREATAATLERLTKEHDVLRSEYRMRSANRVAREIARLARQEHLVVSYLNALFEQMNHAQSMLDPESGQQAAIEAIALLESEERARQFQPQDFPDQEYERTVAWMSACAYDNLAEHTAMMLGYNSEGMHACIGDGIQVCRRTGKLACITCFREYATDVHRSADDIDMALHYANLVRSVPENAPSAQRRWVGFRDRAELLLLTGDLEGARKAASEALAMARTYHNTVSAEAHSQVLSATLGLMCGSVDPVSATIAGGAANPAIPEGESLEYDLRRALHRALVASYAGKFDEALADLTHWDRLLSERKCLHEWFDTRLRLLAVQRLAGNTKQFDLLARQLKQRAEAARDFVTLRRLERLSDPAIPATPYPFLESPTTRTLPNPAPAEGSPAQREEPAEYASPLESTIRQFAERMYQAEQDEDGAARSKLLAELTTLDPDTVSEPMDAVRLLHLGQMLVEDDNQATIAWDWAGRLAAHFPQNAVVVNLFALFGHRMLTLEKVRLDETTDADWVVRGLKKSLELDPNNAGNHARAGAYYFQQDELSAAEWCLARASRLERNDSFAALRLAQVYQETERPRDAMAVLDLCLREGCDDAEVAWRAAMTALQLEQYDTLGTYLDRYEALQPDQPWTHYYRALALLETGQPALARTALDLEAIRNPDRLFPVTILRAVAAAALGEIDCVRDLTREVLSTRLSTVDYLTGHGLAQLFKRLWHAVTCLEDEDEVRALLNGRLLEAGLMPDGFFEQVRQDDAEVFEVRLFRCLLRQPLDERWPNFMARLPGQEAWTEYLAYWGVLATDEEMAGQLARMWQSECYPLPATLKEVELLDEGYTDHAGIVWQGDREQEEPAEADETEED